MLSASLATTDSPNRFRFATYARMTRRPAPTAAFAPAAAADATDRVDASPNTLLATATLATLLAMQATR